MYADVETMSILSATDHLLLKYDKDYGLSDFMSRLRQRPDTNEKMMVAFEELLNVIKKDSNSHHGAESLMESGLVPPGDGTDVPDFTVLVEQDGGARGSSSSNSGESDDDFENALEQQINIAPPEMIQRKDTSPALCPL